ncbi:hypothetical protein THOG05_40244 [Vibrio rotiferianus]|nr:hypothetical protein THOG05_40244 [Vibrio rotiferianus]CAH1577034.1 hypothetical protein THOE12_50225 [Vibrio rotiferianus]CAH1585533.1 hypothetical protein THOG10_40009 [Vibrio rotiferianus]CAH1587633.1 hypothetical protein THOB06_40009 [Vibrio rotiferianus]
MNEYVTKYFRDAIIQLSTGKGGSDIYANKVRGHRSDLFLTVWRFN